MGCRKTQILKQYEEKDIQFFIPVTKVNYIEPVLKLHQASHLTYLHFFLFTKFAIVQVNNFFFLQVPWMYPYFKFTV